MRQQLIDLWEIQKIDVGILELEKTKALQPLRLNELEEKTNAAKAKLKELTDQRDLLATEIRNIESSVTSESDKTRKWERRLNDIRNQREYQALNREVEGSKRAVRDSEEQVIELMAKKDELDAQIETLQDEVAETAVDADAERTVVLAKIAELDLQVKQETERREKLMPKVRGTVVRRYDAIRIKRMGLGLVAAKDGSCSGCNMRLPPQLYNILMRVDTIETCPSCNRILVFQGVLDDAQTPAAEIKPSGPDVVQPSP